MKTYHAAGVFHNVIWLFNYYVLPDFINYTLFNAIYRRFQCSYHFISYLNRRKRRHWFVTRKPEEKELDFYDQQDCTPFSLIYFVAFLMNPIAHEFCLHASI